MITRFIQSFIVLFIFGSSLMAQQGGSQIFSFLNVPTSSFSHALGGINISGGLKDVSSALQNPAILGENTKNTIGFNYTFHTSGIRSGSTSYSNYSEKFKVDWHAGVQFMQYGEFQGADEWGNLTSTFNAADYAFVFGATKHLNEKFHIGVNSKIIYSRLEDYIATGLAFDIGGIYNLTEQNTNIGLSIRNIGFVLNSYADNGGNMPFDLQLGITKKLKYLPFRYHVTAHHLYKWDVRYDDPGFNAANNVFGEDTGPSIFAKNIDNLFRHFIFGGEFLLGKKENLKLRFAYNHMLKRELSVVNLRTMTGFSGGIEFKIKQFSVAYSFGLQHLHGSSKQLSISTNFSNFKKKS